MKKFNPKQFTGNRIYNRLTNFPGISKLWIWNPKIQEYQPPERGKSYLAKRYQLINGKRTRVPKMFATLNEALKWQSTNQDHLTSSIAEATSKLHSGPTFEEALSDWKIKKFLQFKDTTKLRYRQLLESKAFGYFKNVCISEINPKFIDQWIAYLKDPKNGCWSKSIRVTFKYELDVLAGILNNFINYSDDTSYQFPIKERHYSDCRMKESLNKEKDLTKEEFLKFRNELLAEKYGAVLADLATVQYSQALRINEACGLSADSIQLNFSSVIDSTLIVKQSVVWPRTKEQEPYLQKGYKNSKTNGGYKMQYLYPESFYVLKKRIQSNSSELLFTIDGKIIPYRTIQYYYNKAFKKAGIDRTSTHVLRHGGSNQLYQQTGDFAAGQALLGNKSVSASQVYLHTRNQKLKSSVIEAWKEYETQDELS